MPICFFRNFFSRTLLVAYLALAVNPATQAQEPQPAQSAPLDVVAAKMADAIAHSKEKTVIVFDFTGPGNKQTVLGQTLADEFADALTRSSGKFKVEDRSKTRSVEDRILISDDLKLAIVAAQIEGAKSLVHGKLSLDGNNLTLNIDSYDANSAKRIGGFQAAIPFKDEWKESAERVVEGSDLSKYSVAGKGGPSMPTCIYCPRADYTNEALENKFSGVILLMVLITPDGRARITKVEKPLPYGLTMSAIQNILTWKLKPAAGPDGVPVAVIVPIEVQFNVGDR
jgi:Gram-negative bacterial TonB protein C-terminal